MIIKHTEPGRVHPTYDFVDPFDPRCDPDYIIHLLRNGKGYSITIHQRYDSNLSRYPWNQGPPERSFLSNLDIYCLICP